MADHTTHRVTTEVPVFYSTSEGQTRRIARRLAANLREHGFDSRALDMAGPAAAAIDWTRVRGALVGASLHRQQHQKAAARFVADHAIELNGIPSAFFSVSLSAASANRLTVEAARDIANAFPVAHGWRPDLVVSFGGRLAYTQYGFFTRQLMKWIARKEGAPVDTTQDHEFTDWTQVDALARILAAMVQTRSSTAA